MQQIEQLPQVNWLDYFANFSDDNKGRLITIELIDMADGYQPLADASPLLAIDYDPVNKGNNITISTGIDVLGYMHTIDEPNEIWQQNDDDGRVMSLEIKNQANSNAIITFES